MKIYSIPFFCLLLAACGSAPKLAYPTGENRVPINISPNAITPSAPKHAAVPAPVLTPAPAAPATSMPVDLQAPVANPPPLFKNASSAEPTAPVAPETKPAPTPAPKEPEAKAAVKESPKAVAGLGEFEQPKKPEAKEVKPAKPAQEWKVKKDSTVRETVGLWAKTAGYELKWQAEDLDYRILDNYTFTGEFLDAMKGLFGALDKTPLHGSFYTSQKLLVVKKNI